MPTPTPYQLSLDGATWVDVNSEFLVNTYPDLMPDDYAIANSLMNLLRCPIGARGQIFQPTYGSLFLQWLHEPIDAFTAAMMWNTMVAVIPKWEPRISLITDECSIVPVTNSAQPGYIVTITGFKVTNGKKMIVKYKEGTFLA
jgi:phage baseplate assembly protein W